MKAALAIGAVYGLLARRACPCRFLLDGCLAAQSPSSARRAQIADRVGMYDIGSRGADRGVDPANGVGSRCDTQGSAKAYELSAFLAAQHTVRLSDNRLHRLPQALDRVGTTLRIKALVLVAAPNERVVHQRYWTCGAAWQAATIESAPRRSTMQENFMLTLELRSSAGSRSKRPKPV